MKKQLKFMVSLVVLLLNFVLVSLGQVETGQISGTITDPNGAVIPGANVAVRSTRTNAIRTAITNEDGFYQITNLLPGVYEVSAKSGNFAEIKRNVEITVGQRATENVQLGVANVEAQVEVISGASVAEINTTDQQVSNVVTEKLVTELPTITRNPYALVVTAGNVSPADPAGRGVGYAINGQRSSSTSILLNGGENVDTFRANVGQSVPLDSVQEFRVITSNFTAEFGRASGGIVNLVTKAGSNNYHGTVYEFNRVSKLSSNGFNNNARGIPRGVFTRNQFGYSIGGPLPFFHFGEGGPFFVSGKDRLFFFNSTEWTRVRSTGARNYLVPTQQLINLSSPATQNFFNTFGRVRNGRPGRVFTVADVIAIRGVGAGAFASLPGNTPAFQEIFYDIPRDLGAGAPQNTVQTIGRIDYSASDKFQMFGVYALERQDFFPGTVSTSPYAGYDTGSNTFNQNFQVTGSYNISPNLVSQTKFTYNRLRDSNPLGANPAGPTLYLLSSRSSLSGVNIGFPGYLPFSPGSAIPFGGPQNVYQLNEDISYLVGEHTFKFGGQYIRINDNRVFGAYQNSVQTLGGNYTQGLNNFVQGRLLQFQGAVDPQGRFPGQTVTLPVGQPQFGRRNRYDEFALYAQDTWRTTRRLTLNLGIRYEYFGPQRNANENLDSNFYFGNGSNLFEQIRNGSVQIAPNSSVGGLWKPDKNNFAPRLGFAYDFGGNGKTVIRGGYGIAYERNFGNVTFNVIQNPPNYAVISIFPADVGGVIPITTSNTGPLSGNVGSVTLPRTSLRHVREDIVNAYAHFYSLSFERRVLKNTTFSVDYSGSAGRELYSLENYNRVGSGLRYLGSTVACPPFSATNRLNCQYSNINTRANSGYSNYNGVTLNLTSNNLLNSGLTMTARYTYSVAKDNLSSTFSESSNNFNLGLTDPFNPSLDYGYADFDIRHRFTSSFVWDLPFAKQSSGLAKQLIGGFTLTGIITARTGSPFTVFDCTHALTTCIRLIPTGSVNFGAPTTLVDTGRANTFVYTDLSNQTPSNFTDVSGFTEVGPFPTNMTRRNAFRGPGFWNVDLGLYKTFFFTERYRLQLRAEAFNVFNHANLFIDGTSAEVNNGQVTAFKDGRRNIQLAVKFIF